MPVGSSGRNRHTVCSHLTPAAKTI